MRNIFTFLFFLFTFFVVAPSTTYANFVKSISNPLFEVSAQPGEPLSIPVFSVAQTNSDYKMWFTEYSNQKHQIALAVSSDGLNWTPYSSNPVVSPNLNDPSENEIGGPYVIYENSSYTMWFTSLNFSQPDPFKISRSTSTDGINWTPHQIVFTKSNAPWESEGVNKPSILHINGEYKMWYSARDYTGTWRIGYAVSLDGVTWNRYPSPVLEPSFNWESNVVASNDVIFQNGIYHMYYHAGPIFLHYLGHATSTDGINWTKDPDPILTRSNDGNCSLGGFDCNMIAAPNVIRVNNKLRMYYAGHDGTHWRIGIAEELQPIPYFSQKDPIWEDDEYDNAHVWTENPNYISMESYGCAVTSAAMVLRYYNVYKTPGNPETGLLPKELTPGTLNEWLKDAEDADFRNGVTNFQSIADMTIKSHELDPTMPKLEYSQGFTIADIDQELNSNRPAILKLEYLPSESDMHFVVATASANTTYGIHDPYYEERVTLSPHYDTVLRVDKYQVTNSDFSYLIFAIDEVVDLELLNNFNESVGQVQLEKPIFDQVQQSSSGAETLKVLYYKYPPPGEYTLKISAPDNQSYQLDTYVYDQKGNKELQTFTGTVGPSDTDNFQLSFDKENVENSEIAHVSPSPSPTPSPTPVPTPTPSPSPSPSPTPATLKLQYYPDPAARGKFVDTVLPDFNIVNAGMTPVPLSELKIRYYFTQDTPTPQDMYFYCDFTELPLGCGSITGHAERLSSPLSSKADSYLEVGFTGGFLSAGSQTWDILVDFTREDEGNFNQYNDYSFQDRDPTFRNWKKVTLYRNGQLVWGVEPN